MRVSSQQLLRATEFQGAGGTPKGPCTQGLGFGVLGFRALGF